MDGKTILKLVAAIASISVMAGGAQAQYRTPQQVREAQQVAHMQNILAQLQAAKRQQDALRRSRVPYVQPLASSTHAGVLGGSGSSLGSTTIGGNTLSGGLTTPHYIYPLPTRNLNPYGQAVGTALDSYRSQSTRDQLNVNVYGTHVYRRY